MNDTQTLKIIGTGFGRTGTDSMRTALEILGFGPCHHMRALVDDPAHKDDWQRCIEAGEMDWDLLLGGFAACIDWPSAAYWPDLIERFPQAKVLLTWRSTDSWYASMAKTILPSVERMIERAETSPGRLTLMQALGDRAWSKQSFRQAYEDNVARVKALVPPERLLIYTLGDGWGPLCDFLGVEVPGMPFPRTNDAQAFHKWVD